jgi:hypothetical protein
MNAPMKSLRLLLPLSLLLLTTASTAQQLCPCFPHENLWTVKTCDGFQCASTMLTAANGDPLTFVMPVSVDDQRWIVMRRVVSGTYTDDGSDPYQLEQFDGISVATARLASIASDHRPMIITAPDGMFLVASLKQAPVPHQRVVVRR